ncbi:MAG: hypothetical protein BZ135_06915 [Methanosphaera sp. rholeuAM6]|nr:MAG: hypothetical protein BZ135_06915 [Methanosphaera sp. rholeuAM6]
MNKNNNALFYTCSLIEFISRQTNNHRNTVINLLGNDLERIYNYSDIFHQEPIEKVADDFITRNNISTGQFDNVSECKYIVPGYWDIGEVFERLIEDCYDEENVFVGIREVYDSWLADKILNFNTDLYYQPRDYLRECYKEGKIVY